MREDGPSASKRPAVMDWGVGGQARWGEGGTGIRGGGISACMHCQKGACNADKQSCQTDDLQALYYRENAYYTCLLG